MLIATRLILLVIAAILPVLGGALWVVNETYRAERESLDRNLRDTTRAFSLVVDRELGKRDAIARVLSMSHFLDNSPNVVATDLRQFETQAERAMEGTDGSVILSSLDGKVVSTRTTPASIPPEAAAAAVLATGGGRGVISRLPLTSDDGPQRVSIVRAVQRGGQAVMNLAVTVLPAELQRLTAQQSIPDGWIAGVLDSYGVVVARHPNGERWVGQLATQDLREQMHRSSEGFFESTSLDGTPILGYFSTASYGWSFVLSVPREQVGNSLQRSLIRMVLLGVALLCLATVLAWWVGRRIAQPVQKLSAAARQLQRGQPVVPETTGILECDRVSTALAEASETILRGRSEMQREVERAVMQTREAEQRASQGERVEALGRLTGGVAHDFNNLLGVISNSIHLMRRLPADGDLSVPLAAIQRATEVGMRLTRHLLRFAGRQPLQPAPVDLRTYLPDSAELLKTVLGSSIRITVRVANDTHPIRVDASELELALINLALNARDAMPSGGTFELAARNAISGDIEPLPAGDCVLLTVSDTGSGIPADLRERVFEPFFTTKGVGKGTGLGLSQVYGFCTQAGGAVQIIAGDGAGTTVMMVLPAPQKKSLERAAPPPSELSHQSDAEGERLLLVEDNETLAEVSVALLGSFGYRATHVANAEQALQRLAESDGQFDVVLSDIVMPGEMDGMGLAHYIRTHYPNLPIVLISGYSETLATRHDFVVLEKPCPPDVLLGALRDATAGSLAGAAGPPR